MYLKTQYGSGYHLIVKKDKEHCDSQDVLRFIQQYIPRTKLIEDLGSEMTFIMPTFDESHHVLSTVLEDLERVKDDLAIDKYGISYTTLEEVIQGFFQAKTIVLQCLKFESNYFYQQGENPYVSLDVVTYQSFLFQVPYSPMFSAKELLKDWDKSIDCKKKKKKFFTSLFMIFIYADTCPIFF